MEEGFKTPISKRVIRKTTSTPTVLIPPSPSLKKLGFGTGVNVYLIERYSPLKGSYKSPWAVKKANRKCGINSEYAQRLKKEAEILKKLNHPNIIGFRNLNTAKDGSTCLFMEDGQKSLTSLIEARLNHSQLPFPAKHIKKVGHEIASALCYLHTKEHLLHGDIKSANILIKGDFQIAKLCDFGVTLPLNEKLELKDKNSCYIGTECWSAPEVIIEGTISDKTDIFSFGLVLWEMISLSVPHLDKLTIEESTLDSTIEIEEKEAVSEELFQAALGTRPALPDYKLSKDYDPVLAIFYASTEDKASNRPSARAAQTILS